MFQNPSEGLVNLHYLNICTGRKICIKMRETSLHNSCQLSQESNQKVGVRYSLI